MPPFEVQENLE